MDDFDFDFLTLQRIYFPQNKVSLNEYFFWSNKCFLRGVPSHSLSSKLWFDEPNYSRKFKLAELFGAQDEVVWKQGHNKLQCWNL